MKFTDKVYKITSKIPKGKISTYKLIAEALSCKAYRAVGTALHKNPYAPKVPCHRVINSNGSIGGFAPGPKRKIKLLQKEGVKIKNYKVINFKKVLYKFK